MNSEPQPIRRSRRLWLAGIVIGILAVAAGETVHWWPKPPPPIPPVVKSNFDDIDDPQIDPNPGYVGMRTCAKCHAKRVAEFQTTKHFHACREPEPGMMAPGFAAGKGLFAFGNPKVQFEMTQAGHDFLQSNTRETDAGTQKFDAKIGLVYGSTRTADEVYFTWHDDRLYELPVVWLHTQNRWATEAFNPFGNRDLTRTTTTRCLECHNTWIEHVPGTENQYKRDHMLLGVTCEKCHGPGREHVTFHTANPKAEKRRQHRSSGASVARTSRWMLLLNVTAT